jgi:hypothetical protein
LVLHTVKKMPDVFCLKLETHLLNMSMSVRKLVLE